MEPIIHPIFEKRTSTWQYIVACPETHEAVIIDPVLDFDPSQLTVTTTSADELLYLATSKGYHITRILETHAHADHLTAAHYIQTKLHQLSPKVPICTGHRIRQVQATFAQRYNIPPNDLETAFDHLFQDDETFQIGRITAQVLHLPGHTPDHSGYMIGSNVFTGDSIFNPDVGSARCDFPHGDARALYQTMRKLLALPEHVKLYTGHDYPPAVEGDSTTNRAPKAFVTVKDQKEENKHVKEGTVEEEFVKWRQERDSALGEPRLLHPSLQVNVRGGRLPWGDTGNRRRAFLWMPVKVPEVMESGGRRGVSTMSMSSARIGGSGLRAVLRSVDRLKMVMRRFV
ncbi:metallo-beta-lactamase superfamily protein [Aspergillus eucalypticola CBS 122712]|uniref:Metallo-beta-lactamase superfamily protein n=1 Tax=Aspergillus eucalypticola (strain CBS 122712 / IBT 29274) TaxID=1448314 RepID=A0A317VC70_ASPEC|nr:metallo-beta-lactamase superfamily protein [Aspergillus eucalypticola CBS 122712]PWY70588.1 metallo-beta-lactamase superfamily protein [Aspergillus eucalypticola CBS 122712]